MSRVAPAPALRLRLLRCVRLVRRPPRCPGPSMAQFMLSIVLAVAQHCPAKRAFNAGPCCGSGTATWCPALSAMRSSRCDDVSPPSIIVYMYVCMYAIAWAWPCRPGLGQAGRPCRPGPGRQDWNWLRISDREPRAPPRLWHQGFTKFQSQFQHVSDGR